MIEKAVSGICDAIFKLGKVFFFLGIMNAMLNGKGTFFLKGQHYKEGGPKYGKIT